MPPKGKKGKKAPLLIDGVDTTTMNRDQLEAFAIKLKAELDREREERNFFQLERDKIRTFWEITRVQMEDMRIELRNKDRELEMAQEVGDTETKHIMQQMKHLQYENFNKLGEVRAEALTQLKLAQEDHIQQEQELLKDKRELRRMLREKDETYELQIQELLLKQHEEMSTLELKYNQEAKDLKLLNEEKMKMLKDELEMSYRMQMFQLEETKNTQIQNLIDSHDKAFNDMKNYYNDITLNNLGLISSLKEQMETLRKQTDRSDRLASELQVENKKLKEPLEAANAKLIEFKRKLAFYDRDKQQLLRLKKTVAALEKNVKDLTWETEALLLRNEALVTQREELKEKFDQVVIELQQKTGLENVILERKIQQLEKEAEKRELVLQQTIATCCCVDIDAREEADRITRKVDEAIDEKNKIIADLRFELSKIVKAHDDLLATYESKLAQFGIPLEELGFEPLRFSKKWPYLCGPAGLVTTNL